MRTQAKILFLLLCFAGTAVFAESNSYRSKFGIDFKVVKMNAFPDIGWIAGLAWARYLGNSQVHVGLAGYYGAPTGTAPDRDWVLYGGATLGYEFKLSRKMIADITLMIGYGQGKMSQLAPVVEQRSYYVVEPNLSVGFLLGGGWRLTFSGSYLHMHQAPNFSGPALGFRFTYKSVTSIRDLND